MNQDQSCQYLRTSAYKRQRLDQPSNLDSVFTSQTEYHFSCDPSSASRYNNSTWVEHDRNSESNSNSDVLTFAEQWTSSSRSSHSDSRDNHNSREFFGNRWIPSSSSPYSHLSEDNKTWPAVGIESFGEVGQVPEPNQVCFGMVRETSYAALFYFPRV